MSTRNVLVVLPVNNMQADYLESHAQGGNFDCAFCYRTPETVQADEIALAHAIIGNVRPSMLGYAPQLEWIQLGSAGADDYMGSGILPMDVAITSASGAYGLAVSEHMLGMTFDMIRHFGAYHANQRDHIWRPEGNVIAVERSCVVVLGLGDIGCAYARKMKALGAYVIGVRRTQAPIPDFVDEQYLPEDLDQVLPRAQIVAMALPGGPLTHHIMDERRLRLINKYAYLINVGRGSTVDLDGLRRVLASGRLAGVALDVTDPEPLDDDDPLWDDPRVFITPHVAGQFFLPQTIDRVVRIAAENMRNWVRRMPFAQTVDRGRGY